LAHELIDLPLPVRKLEQPQFAPQTFSIRKVSSSCEELNVFFIDHHLRTENTRLLRDVQHAHPVLLPYRGANPLILLGSLNRNIPSFPRPGDCDASGRVFGFVLIESDPFFVQIESRRVVEERMEKERHENKNANDKDKWRQAGDPFSVGVRGACGARALAAAGQDTAGQSEQPSRTESRS